MCLSLNLRQRVGVCLCCCLFRCKIGALCSLCACACWDLWMGTIQFNVMFFVSVIVKCYLSLSSSWLCLSIVLWLGVTIFGFWMNGVRTYDEPSELVDMEWRLPARFADDDGATSTDLWMLPEEDRFLCDDEDIADAWSVVQHITHIHT